MSGTDRRRSDERGSVTAELAVTLPAVVVVLLAILVAGSVGTAQLRCWDGARVGARSAALGADDGVVTAAAQRAAGDGAQVAVSGAGEWVEVRVARDVRTAFGASIRVEAHARALREPVVP